MIQQISLRLPDELLREIDEARGLVPRNTWLVHAAREKLGRPEPVLERVLRTPLMASTADPQSVPRGPRGREDLYERGAMVRARALGQRRA